MDFVILSVKLGITESKGNAKNVLKNAQLVLQNGIVVNAFRMQK